MSGMNLWFGAKSGSIAAITGGNIPFVLAHYNVPVGNGGSGSMANNGVATFTTAVPVAYANAFVLLPAGAIAAGVPAAPNYYFCQFSSTTVATFFNNTLSANLDAFGGPTIPASPTAFATTGPGAFTAATTVSTMLTWALPASTIGVNGELYIDALYETTNNANAKTITNAFGGTNLFNQSIASMPYYRTYSEISNINSASVQNSENHGVTGANTISGTFEVPAAVNTGSAVNITFASTHSGAATDHIFLRRLKITALTP